MLKNRPTVAVVDDHPLVAFGLCRALQDAGCELLGAAHGASDLMALLAHAACDIVIVDCSMPKEGAPDGWNLLTTLSRRHPRSRIIVHTEFEDHFLVGALVQRGVAGIVSKSEDIGEMLAAVTEVGRGRTYLSPVVRTALSRFRAEPALQRFRALTARQMDVAGLMLCGVSVQETACLLERSKSTVSMRRIRACRLLGFKREADMHRFASRLGLRLDGSGQTPVFPAM